MKAQENVLPLEGSARSHARLIATDELRGAIGRQPDAPPPPGGEAGIGTDLVVARQPFHPRSEELRALRTQLLIRWSIAGVTRRGLAVISPGCAEGRSYVAANLAVLFAQLGERTLLIDADLRAPRQHRIFNLPDDGCGLSAVLSGRTDGDAVMRIPEFGPLSVLPAGVRPANPQELLLRPLFTALLDRLEAQFDVILFDTPPAKPYADAQSLAHRAGSVVLLARKDRTSLADTTGVIARLNATGTRIIGSVLNAF